MAFSLTPRVDSCQVTDTQDHEDSGHLNDTLDQEGQKSPS